jgi:hypothetical protein
MIGTGTGGGSWICGSGRLASRVGAGALRTGGRPRGRGSSGLHAGSQTEEARGAGGDDSRADPEAGRPSLARSRWARSKRRLASSSRASSTGSASSLGGGDASCDSWAILGLLDESSPPNTASAEHTPATTSVRIGVPMAPTQRNGGFRRTCYINERFSLAAVIVEKRSRLASLRPPARARSLSPQSDSGKRKRRPGASVGR